MNFFAKLFLILLLIFLNSCSKEKQKIAAIEEKEIKLQMIDAYKEGVKALEEGDVLYSAKKFNEAEILFPQSVWAPKSVLMAAYAYYSQDYYSDAIYELERFILTYSQDKRLSYAHYLLAMCYYEEIVDEKKDLQPLLNAQDQFKLIIKNYPDSDFALDSKFKLDLINDVLASKEIYLGRYYIKREKWIAAINRFRKVVDEYETTIYVEEALHRLVEIHYKIGLTQESKKYAKVLGYNYQSSEWYKQSYKVFNKDYEVKKKEVKKKRKKGLIWKKFKSLFKFKQ